MNNNKVLGICNLHNAPSLGGLTQRRSYGSVTMLGRYALMDFALSNFSNSGIDSVITLVPEFPNSIHTHIRSGSTWTANMKTGFQYISHNDTPNLSKFLNTDINNVLSNIIFINTINFDYVVFAPSHYLSSMDFRPIIEAHEESGKDCTFVYIDVKDGTKSFASATVVNLDENGDVKYFRSNTQKKDHINVSLDTFIINKELFFKILREAPNLNPQFSFQKMIAHLNSEKEIKIGSYKFEHYVTPITNLKEYVNNSFSLLKYENRKKLFRNDWPIYTTTHDTPPAKYGEYANTKDCIISNGCIINGKVEHSILSRNVIVDKGCTVSNSIIFTDSVITNKSKVSYIVTEKNVFIETNTNGDEEQPLFIKNAHK